MIAQSKTKPINNEYVHNYSVSDLHNYCFFFPFLSLKHLLALQSFLCFKEDRHTFLGINCHYKEMLFIYNWYGGDTVTQWYCCKCTAVALNEYSCYFCNARQRWKPRLILLKDFNSSVSYEKLRRFYARFATDVTWYRHPKGITVCTML